MSYEYVKKSRMTLKKRLLYIMGDKCCICGYDKCTSALEFHHKDPSQKDFTLGENANMGFEKAKEEIKKCILVCANCHREIHQFDINVDEYECYNETKAQEKSEEVEALKTHKVTYCKDCGTIISSKAERCPICANLVRRVCKRPSRQELKDLIRTTPFVQIAKQFSVTDNAIRKWCKSLNLPSKKTEINNYSDAE